MTPSGNLIVNVALAFSFPRLLKRTCKVLSYGVWSLLVEVYACDLSVSSKVTCAPLETLTSETTAPGYHPFEAKSPLLILWVRADLCDNVTLTRLTPSGILTIPTASPWPRLGGKIVPRIVPVSASLISTCAWATAWRLLSNPWSFPEWYPILSALNFTTNSDPGVTFIVWNIPPTLSTSIFPLFKLSVTNSVLETPNTTALLLFGFTNSFLDTVAVSAFLRLIRGITSWVLLITVHPGTEFTPLFTDSAPTLAPWLRSLKSPLISVGFVIEFFSFGSDEVCVAIVGAVGNFTSSCGNSLFNLLRLTLYVSPNKDISSDSGIALIAPCASLIAVLNWLDRLTACEYSSWLILGLPFNSATLESNVIFFSFASLTFCTALLTSWSSLFPLSFKSLTG